jgi:hypothetical protein
VEDYMDYLERLFSLKDKAAPVSGGGRGIGRAAAPGIAKAGAGIAVISRNGADEAVRPAYRKGGGQGYSLIARPVGDPEEPADAVIRLAADGSGCTGAAILPLTALIPAGRNIGLVQKPGWFSANLRLAYKSCKMLRILPFPAEFVQKLKFLNNSIILKTFYPRMYRKRNIPRSGTSCAVLTGRPGPYSGRRSGSRLLRKICRHRKW